MYKVIVTTDADQTEEKKDEKSSVENSNHVISDKENNVYTIDVKANATSEYDPYQFGNTKHSTTYWGNVTHLIVIAAGPTVLSFPLTFVNVGYTVGFIGTLLTVLFYMYCMRSIVSTEYTLCKRLKRPNMSYLEVIYEAFHSGPKCISWMAKYTHYLIYGAFMCIWIGGNSIFLLLACGNLKCAYDYFFDSDISIRLIMIYLVVPLVLLCWIPNLKYLVPCSLFTNAINAIALCTVLYDAVSDSSFFQDRLSVGSMASVPLFLGTILFTLNATGLILPLKNDMKNPRTFNSTFGVLTASYIPVSILYSFFGVLCYLKHGDRVNANVLLNLPPTRFSKIITGASGIGICFLYPIIAYVSFEIIWNNNLKGKLENSEGFLIYEYTVRTCIAVSSIVLAYVVPNIGLFLSVAGTICTSIDSIIFPAMIDMLVHCNGSINFAKNMCIIIFAIILIVSGTFNSVSEIIEYYSS